MPFREKVFRFFYGRYGMDKLNYFLLVVYLVISLVNLIIKSYIISAIEGILVIVALVRMLSRNIYKRRNENQVFLKAWNGIKSFFTLQKDKYKDKNTHVYKKCKQCKAIIRLPKKPGEHYVTCPNCQNRFKVKI